MSQEIDKGQVLPPTPPSNMMAETDNSSMCVLSVLFVIVGIAAIILGLVCAVSFAEEYNGYRFETNTALVVLYLAGGVLTGMFNFALAVIVDACQKYRKTYEG